MTVFRGFLKVIRANRTYILIYVLIFTVLAVLMAKVTAKGGTVSYEAASVPITVVDHDQSQISKGLVRYLKTKNEVKVTSYDREALTQSLYNQDTCLVVQVPKGFGDSLAEGKGLLKVTPVPGLDSSRMAQADCEAYLKLARICLAAGDSQRAATDRVLGMAGQKVNVDFLSRKDENSLPGWAVLTRYYPYLFLSVIIYVIAMTMKEFKRKGVKARMEASPVPPSAQTGQALLAFGLLCGFFFLVSLVLPAATGKGFFGSPHLGLLVLNILMLLLFTISVGWLVSLLASSPGTITALVNVAGLGFSFLCGVFIPLDFMSGGLKKFASFIPIYWYERINQILAARGALGGADQAVLRQGLQVQAAGIAVVLIVSALAARGIRRNNRT